MLVDLIARDFVFLDLVAARGGGACRALTQVDSAAKHVGLASRVVAAASGGIQIEQAIAADRVLFADDEDAPVFHGVQAIVFDTHVSRLHVGV